MQLPDFIIAGAPRSATTWLYRLAERHPSLAMAKPVAPEPKFFLVDDVYERGLEHYARTWFDDLPADRLLGEKSTNYLESPVAARRMRAALPGVKLIFLLRDPVDRAYSNYLWSRQNGREDETFERALELEDERERTLPAALRYARPHAYFSRGLYAAQLRTYVELFGRDRILVLKSEDVAADPRSVANRLFAFLGVAAMPQLADDVGVVNAAENDGSFSMDAGVRERLAARYREPNRELSELLGPGFVAWSATLNPARAPGLLRAIGG